MTHPQNMYGLLAEFTTPQQLVRAATAARLAGYRRMDAYSPFRVEGLAEAMQIRGTRLSWLVLTAGVAGAAGGLLLQWYSAAVDYPLNIGGRPLASWPSFVPVAFELAILAAATAAVIGMLVRNGLPRPYHPVFNCEAFKLASRDRFFLCIEASDPKFDLFDSTEFLQSLSPHSISEATL